MSALTHRSDLVVELVWLVIIDVIVEGGCGFSQGTVIILIVQTVLGLVECQLVLLSLLGAVLNEAVETNSNKDNNCDQEEHDKHYFEAIA
jgi:hypothetical protein